MRIPISAFRLLLVTVLIAGFSILPGFAPSATKKKGQPEISGSPYLMTTCTVSGRPLPEDGGHVVVMSNTSDPALLGREFRFCCPGCVKRFKNDPKDFIKKLDKRMIKEQTPRYPPGVCPIMEDEEMPDPRGPEADDCTQLIWKNRLIRLCCRKCARISA